MKRDALAVLAMFVMASALMGYTSTGRWGDIIARTYYDTIYSSTFGGAPVYYARDFDSAGSSSTDGIAEAIAHCETRMSGRGCTVVLDSGDYDIDAQFILSGGIRLVGAGGNVTRPATRLDLNTALTTSNADCSGETIGHRDASDPLCAPILVRGSGNALEGFSINCAGGGVIRSDTCIEIMGQDDGAGGDTDYNTRGTMLRDLSIRGASHAGLYIICRDGSTSCQVDHIHAEMLDFTPQNAGIALPLCAVAIDAANTSQNRFEQFDINKGRNASVCLIQGEFQGDMGSASNGNSSFPTASTTCWLRAGCHDALSVMDSADPYSTCATPSTGQTDKFQIGVTHWEMGGASAADYGAFICNDTTGTTVGEVENSTFFANAGATYDLVAWNGPGRLTWRSNEVQGGASADLAQLDIDCDNAGCDDLTDSGRLIFHYEGDRHETSEVSLLIDFSDDALRFVGDALLDQAMSTAKTSSDTLTYSECKATIITNDGASGGITLTLPANPNPGLVCRIALTDAQDVNIAVQGADACTPGASCDTILGMGDEVSDEFSSDATVGSMLELQAHTANEWFVIRSVGTWSDVD